MKITQLLLQFPKKKPKFIQMTFNFKKEDCMKVNAVKFFRGIKHEPFPQPQSSVKPRFELVRKGKKLDRFV